MTAPNVVQLVADHALAEADANDQQAAELEERAASLRKRAEVLRALHAVAEPHARPSTLDRGPVLMMVEPAA